MNIIEILFNYKKLYLDLKNSDSFSNNTKNLYKRVLDEFYNFVFNSLSEDYVLSIEKIDKFLLNRYMNELQRNKISTSTRKLYLTIIKGFLFYIADDDFRKYGQIKQQISGYSIKLPTVKAESFTPEERLKILKYTDKLENNVNSLNLNFQNIRDALIIRLLLLTGLRASELCNIKWTDIIDYNETIFEIRILGKGQDQSEVFIPKDESEFLLEKLKELNDSSYAFVAEKTSNPLNKRTLLNICNKHLRILGINKTGVHIFRHTFARHFQALGKEGQTLQALMRHKNYLTTAKYYADVSKQQKSKIIMEVKNPRE